MNILISIIFDIVVFGVLIPTLFITFSSLLGISFILGSFSGVFIILPAIFLTISLYLKFFEEKVLSDRFKEYAAYKAKTNFIIPWFRKEE